MIPEAVRHWQSAAGPAASKVVVGGPFNRFPSHFQRHSLCSTQESSHSPAVFLLIHSREPLCLPLLMRFTLSSPSLVSCCAPFPCIGTLKVSWKYTGGRSTPSKVVRRSLECRHVLIHDLDRCWMPLAMHQLDRMEQEHGQQGSVLL
jgi:hypothetical protein